MKRTRTWLKRTRTAPAPGDRNVKDWILWGALGCVLVSTAHAEYTLATATGVHWFVAGAVPGALDLYVIRALQVRRDVFLSVLAMVGANVASHLVTAGELNVGWQLISAVGALPPLILWRVHSLWYGRVRTRKEILWDVPAPAETAPETVPAQVSGVPAGVHPQVQSFPEDELTLPEWLTDEYSSGAVSAPVALDEWGSGSGDGCTECGEPYPCTCDLEAGAAPHLSVPLPEGWERQVYPDQLAEGDAEYVGALRAYLDECADENRKPSCRGCKEFVRVGQDRAARLMRYAGYPVPVSAPKEGS